MGKTHLVEISAPDQPPKRARSVRQFFNIDEYKLFDSQRMVV